MLFRSLIILPFIVFLANTFSQDQFNEALAEGQRENLEVQSRLGVNISKDDPPKFNSSELKQISKKNDELEIFGLDLFRSSPTTFAPVDFAPAPMNYVLGPGDEIKIEFFGNVNSKSIVQVNREGNLVIPSIGVLQISGMTFNEAQKKIRDTIDASLIGVQVQISLQKVRSIQVFVLGNASNPGAYTVSSLSNISNLLFFSGGPSENGSLRRIEVRRNGTLVGNFDFYNLLVNGDTSSDLRIQSNDALLIRPSGNMITISGEVKNEAIFEIRDEENFEDLINFASGFTNQADLGRITLSRIAENGERIFENFSMEEIKGIKLTDGDEIQVHSFPNTPRNKIMIVGTTSAKGSIAYEDGLALEDIIQPRSLLEDTYTPFVAIQRENIYGSKNLLKSNLLLKSNKTILRPNDKVFIFSKTDIDFINSILVANALGVLDEDDSELLNNFLDPKESSSVDLSNVNQSNQSEISLNSVPNSPTFVQEDEDDDLTKYKCKSLQVLSKQSQSTTIKFVKSKQFPKSNFNPVDELNFFNGCPELFEENPNLLLFALESSSIISGEVRNPGIYPTYLVNSPLDLLSYAGGQTDNSSGLMDIFTHNGDSFNVNIDENVDFQDLGIKGGFYANLSSKIREEVFSVSLEGAFVSPGIYGVRQGERLSSVIKRAGGYKENAFPYGGILARKSVAEKEKIGFLKSADQLKESVASAISSGRISSAGGNPALVMSSVSGLINDLESINPIGRVVSEFDLDTLEKYPEKDILLESGDRLFVPERSSTVTVSGQVLSPTSFSFNPKFKVNDYVQLAGGFQEGADKNRILVIYPNGMASRVRAWPNQPDISPGTSLIIPRDPNPFDWLVFTNILFPIISNFATSAAAIAALGNNN